MALICGHYFLLRAFNVLYEFFLVIFLDIYVYAAAAYERIR